MRVALYYSNNDIKIKEIPVPKISSDELLVRIHASGICGSDVMEWYRAGKVPLVLGHEIAGEISEIGANIKKYKKGDRVAVSHHVPCNTCHYCLTGHHTVCNTLRTTNFDPGGFAEYVRVPAINVDRGVFLLPDNVSYEEATFVEPLACIVRAQRTARLKPGQTVVVIGSGISGLLHIALAKALGAGLILATDINDYRLQSAKKLGADKIFHATDITADKLRELNNGFLADLIILTTGANSAISSALELIERGGTVLFFAPTEPGAAFPLSINNVFWKNDITFTTSYGGAPYDCETALKLIQSKRINVADMITHRLKLEEIEKGFQLVAKPNNSIKIIIEP